MQGTGVVTRGATLVGDIKNNLPTLTVNACERSAPTRSEIFQGESYGVFVH